MTSPARLPDGRSPKSLTHLHLARIIEAEKNQAKKSSIRILDAGCGNGWLIDYLYSYFSAHYGPQAVEVYGFDIAEPGIQTSGFLDRGLRNLEATHPGINWRSRIQLIHSTDTWPYEDGYFDFVVSNQVLEHVHDLDKFLREVYRVLGIGGISINLFPVGECFLEGHVSGFFTHWIRCFDLRKSYLRWLAKLHLDRGPINRQPEMSAKRFGEAAADYVSFYTRYRSWADIARNAENVGFRACYRYTPEFYWTKLWSLVGRDYRSGYAYDRNFFAEALLFFLLKRVSSITVFLEKQDIFKAKDFPNPAYELSVEEAAEV